MEKSKSKFLKILLTIMIFTNTAYAGGQFLKVEKLLEAKKFTQANQEFEELKKKYKSNKNKIKLLQRFSIDFIKLIDNTNKHINNCKDYNCEQIDLNSFNTDYASFKINAGYYSREFQTKIFNKYKSTFKKSNELNDLIIKNNDNKAIARQNKWKQEKKLKKKKEQEFIAKAEQRNIDIDNKIKKLGYGGFTEGHVTRLMYLTQKNGDLNKYLNHAMGCSALEQKKCDKWNSKLKVSQVLKDSVIYRFFEYIDGEILEYSIITKKEPNKIYQENQRFDNGFYIFTGMFTYTTILGVQKSIPRLKKINIK